MCLPGSSYPPLVVLRVSIAPLRVCPLSKDTKEPDRGEREGGGPTHSFWPLAFRNADRFGDSVGESGIEG